MTKEEISEQAWYKKAILSAESMSSDYLIGIQDFKSSLQREIEKKLSILNNQGSTSPTAEKILFAKIDAYNVFLELLNTVEP